VTQPDQITQCHLCNYHGEMDELDVSAMFKFRFVTNQKWKVCRSCDLVFRDEMLPEEVNEEYYEYQYREDLRPDGFPEANDIRIAYVRAQPQLAFLSNLQDKDKITVESMIDVGAGLGATLHYAKSRYFEGINRVLAVEKSQQSWPFLDFIGIPYVSDISEAEGQWDVMIASHVVEHFRNPLDYVRDKMVPLIRPNGLLLVEVPNHTSTSAFSAAHLYAFKQETIGQLLTMAGLHVLMNTLVNNNKSILIAGRKGK